MGSFIFLLSIIISINYINSLHTVHRSNIHRNMHNGGMPKKAVAVLKSDTVNGIIYFQQNNRASATTIYGTINGLTPGLHGFHIHQYGDQTNGCTSAAAHYNPFEKTHGSPTDNIKHIGDLGNIKAGADGVANVNIISNHIQLSGPLSVIGRSLVVHANPDDLGKGNGDAREESLKTGNAGSRIVCSIIGIAPST
ncbi:Extracellular superoxide dismutase [Dirofilaria immitis]